MIEVTPRIEEGIVQVKVLGKLEKSDFAEKIGPLADEVIAEQGKLNGLILDLTAFDGWDGLPALLEHMRFVKNHHKYVRRLAVLGNKTWQKVLPRLAQVFVNAEVKTFDAADAAEAWVKG
ncbi:MAG: STAS/SEC14 domain-containing protein [Planctomycetes bacterium]|nr:STAS/SEC14 domain-containing protein [Planctomycetota bacterium]